MTTFDTALVAFATWLLLGCAGWGVLLCAAALLEAVTSGRVRATVWVGCPPVLRRALLSGLGLALAGGGAIPAVAGGQAPNPGAGAADALARLPVPARPVGASATGTGPAPLVVRPGDSLWRLAAARSGPHASAREVADLVSRLHHRNRRVIGPDPDLLHPGQRLVVPRVPDPRPVPVPRPAPRPERDPEERP